MYLYHSLQIYIDIDCILIDNVLYITISVLFLLKKLAKRKLFDSKLPSLLNNGALGYAEKNPAGSELAFEIVLPLVGVPQFYTRATWESEI